MRALVIVALVGGTASAQSLTIGVHGGVNLTRVQADDNVDSAYVTQPVGGAWAALGFYGPLAVRLELDYLQKGGQLTVGGPSGPTTSYTLSYLALPINLRYDLGIGSTSAYVFAGTTLGALLAANQQREGQASQDVKSDLSSIEITVDLGFGITYHLSDPLALVFDVRYSIGLNQLAKNDAVFDTSSWTNRTIQMVAGISYTFGAGGMVGPPTVPTLARAD